MNNNDLNSNTQLPSIKKLIKSIILAMSIATLLLVTTILPAEYGIDPTGVGKSIGLLKMGEIKISLAKEAARELKMQNGDNSGNLKQEIQTVKTHSKEKIKSDSMTVILKSNEAKEIKLEMKKGSIVQYSWSTDGGKVNFNTHADSEKLNIKFHQYEKGSAVKKEGTLEAAFDGKHGWFWRNRTKGSVNIILKVSGDYLNINSQG